MGKLRHKEVKGYLGSPWPSPFVTLAASMLTTPFCLQGPVPEASC